MHPIFKKGAGAIVCFAIHTLNTARLDAHPELQQAQ